MRCSTAVLIRPGQVYGREDRSRRPAEPSRRGGLSTQAELGRVEGIAGLHDTVSYPDAELLPGLVVYRFDAPLIFANGRIFGEQVRAMVEERPDLKCIVIAAEPITDVDTTASDMLQELDEWLNERQCRSCSRK